MSWSAIMPLNLGGNCKTRLALALSADDRRHLVASMADHVMRQMQSVATITRIVVLSPLKPPFSDLEWIADQGGGLNVELARAAEMLGGKRIVFLHADLPFVSADDITQLLESAQSYGVAIAPDHIGEGTNALAMVNATGFVPFFGEGSQAAHQAAFPRAKIVNREGLAFDVDTQTDFEHAMARGFPVTLRSHNIASPL
jgi:2-phospho-L-lactate/phosphoenolpyruvate guanylyltransferase